MDVKSSGLLDDPMTRSTNMKPRSLQCASTEIYAVYLDLLERRFEESLRNV